jgi:hypothetical protein
MDSIVFFQANGNAYCLQKTLEIEALNKNQHVLSHRAFEVNQYFALMNTRNKEHPELKNIFLKQPPGFLNKVGAKKVNNKKAAMK